jgi:hypothetical protein
MFKIYNKYSEKEFTLEQENLYLKELEYYKKYNHPNIIKKIDNYEKEDKFYIKYESVNTLNIKVNNQVINEICNFLEYIHDNNLCYNFLHKNTVFIKNNIFKFTFNSELIYNESNYYKLINTYTQKEKDIFMLGILLYEIYYDRTVNIKKNKYNISLKNYNFETSYINRVIEQCIYYKPKIKLIKNDNICEIFSHRLYEISELKDALYNDLLEGNEKNSIYWASELFGIGLQKDILNVLLKFIVFEIGILYKNLPKIFYNHVNNYFNENHRKRKKITIILIKLLCKLKKNKLIQHVYYLSYKNLFKDDFKKNYDLNLVFNLNEISIIKYIRIYIINKDKYKIWNYLNKKNKELESLYYLDNMFKTDYLIFMAFMQYSNNYDILELPNLPEVKDNKIKYFGFNLKRLKIIDKNIISLDSKRGKPDILLDNTYLGFSLYDIFKKNNILHNFSENEIISNYGYLEFSYKQIYDKYNLNNQNYYELDDNNYKSLSREYLISLENKYNYYFLTSENLDKFYKNYENNIIYDKYNLPILED